MFDRNFLQLAGSARNILHRGNSIHVPAIATYKTDVDDRATVDTDGYFDSNMGCLKKGTIIFVSATNGDMVRFVANENPVVITELDWAVTGVASQDAFLPKLLQQMGTTNTNHRVNASVDDDGTGDSKKQFDDGSPAIITVVDDIPLAQMASNDYWTAKGDGLLKVDRLNSLGSNFKAGSVMFLYSTLDNMATCKVIAKVLPTGINLRVLDTTVVPTTAVELFRIPNMEMTTSSVPVKIAKNFREGGKPVNTLFQFKQDAPLEELIADGTFGITQGDNVGDSAEIDATRTSYLRGNMKTGDHIFVGGTVDDRMGAKLMIVNVDAQGVVTLTDASI